MWFFTLLLISPKNNLAHEESHINPSSTPKILLLNSYHYGYRQSDDVVRILFQRIQQEIPNVDIRLEYMDTKRYDQKDYLNTFSLYLSQKYKEVSFDLLIVADDHALYFMQDLQKKMWMDLPVVFCGLSQYDPEEFQDYPNYTGIIEQNDVEDNIHLIEKLHPNARELYIIIDNTLTGENIRKTEGHLIQQISRLQVHFLNGQKLTLEELLTTLETLPEESVVLYQMWLRDKTGQIYTHEEVLPLISKHSSVPVYGFSEVYLGYGIVGGKLISGTEQGMVAAYMAISILYGIDPQEIPVQRDSHCIYKFDNRQLKRFHISKNKLPDGSQILYDGESFFSKHKNVILTASIILLLQFSLIVYLILNRLWRLKAENALRNEHRLLTALMDNMPDYIYFKDRNSRFIRNNKAHLSLFGLSKQEETLGKSNFDFTSREFAEETLRDEQKIIKSGKPLINKIENISDKKEKTTWVSTTKVPIKDESGRVTTIVGISRNITERKIAAEQIQKSLEEKDILLKEIHHRVKNNLQVISSLLKLQSSHIKDPKISSIFQESQDRIRSMATIHENLYKSPDITHLNLRDYVETLVNGLSRSYQQENRSIEFKLDIEDIPLHIDDAIPCGLIINELVSNALKHGFSDDGKEGKVTIRFNIQEKDTVSLIIQDNGRGMEDHIDWKKINSLGLTLVRILVEDQLHGTLNFTQDHGTIAQIVFPIKKKNQH